MKRPTSGGQLDLDLASLPVPSNRVETSDEAARSIADDVTRMRRLVLNLVTKNGGLTCDQVELMTGLPHQTASARLNDLQRLGRVHDSGERRLTRRDRRAIVWKACVPDESGKGLPRRRRSRGDGDFDAMVDWMEAYLREPTSSHALAAWPVHDVARLLQLLLAKPWSGGAR